MAQCQVTKTNALLGLQDGAQDLYPVLGWRQTQTKCLDGVLAQASGTKKKGVLLGALSRQEKLVYLPQVHA